MTTVWKTVDNELHRRRMTWAALGKIIGASDQVMHNWKARGDIPRKRCEAIAPVFGWTLDRLVGMSTVTPQAEEHIAQEREFTKRASDLAELFDELKDPDVRRKVYTTMMGFLQMAKASEQVPSPKPGTARE